MMTPARCEHKRRGTGRNKTECTDPGRLVVRVAIEADRTTDKGGCTKTGSDIDPAEHKHYPSKKRSARDQIVLPLGLAQKLVPSCVRWHARRHSTFDMCVPGSQYPMH